MSRPQEVVVKICGVTRPEDAEAAARAGADWLGLNFWPRSKRCVDPAAAREVTAAAREVSAPPRLVGVFVDEEPEEIERLAAEHALDYVQLHGDESPALCERLGARAIKSIPLGSQRDIDRIADYPCQTLLVDTPSAGYGGSGRAGDWELARAAVATGRRILLAGGLTPENVAAAVARVGPFGVDVASGVESFPGIKDAETMQRFVAAARM